MDWLLHALGLCPDHMSHPNVLMVASTATGGWFGLSYVYKRFFVKEVTIGMSLKDQREIVKALENIVYSVQRERPRGWHLYPTELRDNAISALRSANITVRNYDDAEASTKQVNLF